MCSKLLHEENQYLDLIREILTDGDKRSDRTGVGTRSVFGRQMSFSLNSWTIPLFTTKRIFFRGVIEELLWFISGDTSARTLANKGVHIWDANSSRAFLDSRGLTDYPEGDLGPIYGFQWRHFGAHYRGCEGTNQIHSLNNSNESSSLISYTDEGVDQLAYIVNTLRSDPFSRRIVLSSWNPIDLPRMALPPCHCLVQFWVSSDYKLSSLMYQRSCDLGLGVPFNVASYSLLTLLLAHVTNMQPGEFIHSMGDVHIYNSHIEPLRQQLQRTPYPFPTIRFRRKVKEITDFTSDDIELVNYKFHPPIKMEMAL